jgi:hypothetical protein
VFHEVQKYSSFNHNSPTGPFRINPHLKLQPGISMGTLAKQVAAFKSQSSGL